MLSIFTKYLLQYKQVCIPNIGTFEIMQEPPQLDVAEKLFLPPFYIAKYRDHDFITDHQRRFFASLNVIARQELEQFGEQLKQAIKKNPFQWKGFGLLSFGSNGIVFEPDQISSSSLQSIPAHKVMRENAQHTMLVGDAEMTTQQVSDVYNKPVDKRPLFMVTGWVVFIIAFIIIFVILYLSGFSVGASGMRGGQ